MRSCLLASGPGWSVRDVVCTSGLRDRPFEERHDSVCIAAVTEGTFQYRSTHAAATLAPGALLLGNDGHCFECGHEHAVGDRCLSFHFTPDYFEVVAAGVPGARRTVFTVSHLPPMPALVPLLAEAESERDACDVALFEEFGLRLAGAVITLLADKPHGRRQPNARDLRRITGALRRIESRAHEKLTLADLARDAAMSPYHFLRSFRQIVGMTPHQFVLRTRMHRVALRLRRTSELVSSIAFDAGFNDLSTFNRRFRQVTGVSPTAYRERRPRARSAIAPR